MPPSHEMQREIYHAWRDFLSTFTWQWHATLTFPHGYNFFSGKRQLSRWVSKIMRKERLVVGGAFMSSHRRGVLHFHVLMAGINDEGKSLADCSRRYYERAFPNLCRIRIVESNAGVCDYVARHFMGYISDYAEGDSFGIEVLQHFQKRTDDPAGDLYSL